MSEDYLMVPRHTLKQTFEKYRQHPWYGIWNRPVQWKQQMPAGHPRYLIDYTLTAQAIHLAYLIWQQELLSEKDRTLIYELFGNPPRFNIDSFNRWWKPEICDIDSQFYLPDHSDPYFLVENTGNAVIDAWLMQQRNSDDHSTRYDRNTTYTYHALRPTDALKSLNFPWHRGMSRFSSAPLSLKRTLYGELLGPTVFELPGNMIEDQIAHQQVLLKVLYLLRKATSNRKPEEREVLWKTLFGEPPRYTIEAFEHWWTFEELGFSMDIYNFLEESELIKQSSMFVNRDEENYRIARIFKSVEIQYFPLETHRIDINDPDYQKLFSEKFKILDRSGRVESFYNSIYEDPKVVRKVIEELKQIPGINLRVLASFHKLEPVLDAEGDDVLEHPKSLFWVYKYYDEAWGLF